MVSWGNPILLLLLLSDTRIHSLSTFFSNYKLTNHLVIFLSSSPPPPPVAFTNCLLLRVHTTQYSNNTDNTVHNTAFLWVYMWFHQTWARDNCLSSRQRQRDTAGDLSSYPWYKSAEYTIACALTVPDWIFICGDSGNFWDSVPDSPDYNGFRDDSSQIVLVYFWGLA